MILSRPLSQRPSRIFQPLSQRLLMILSWPLSQRPNSIIQPLSQRLLMILPRPLSQRPSKIDRFLQWVIVPGHQPEDMLIVLIGGGKKVNVCVACCL